MPIYPQPTISPIVQQECPIQCPQGPPGRDVLCYLLKYYLNFNVSISILRCIQFQGVDGHSIIGEKGERGERGFPVIATIAL